MKGRIVIPKKGKNIGNIVVEGMEENENCKEIIEEIAVSFGSISSSQKKDHFDDDNPVHDSVFNS